MSFYKDVWNEKYCQLSLDLFEKEYWECTQTELTRLDREINRVMADWMAERIDAAKDHAKYERLK